MISILPLKFVIIFTHQSFSHQCLQMVFHWRLSDCKYPQVSRTLLCILAVFNNAVVWMFSIRPPTSKFSRPFNKPLVFVPKAPITIGIIVTSMFHSFFNSLARSRYLSLFSHSFSFILWSAGTAKSIILQIFFFFFWLLKGLVFWLRFADPFVCQSIAVVIAAMLLVLQLLPLFFLLLISQLSFFILLMRAVSCSKNYSRQRLIFIRIFK